MNRSVVGWLVGFLFRTTKNKRSSFSLVFRISILSSSSSSTLPLFSLSPCVFSCSLFRTLSSKKKKNQKKKKITMFPQQWSSPCGNQCTNKYSALMQIPWRVFCKKGCNADGDTWEECLEECEEICYKDPVLKDHQWSAYIDRSPGADNYSAECFHACVAGCGYKFDVPSKTVDQVHPNRPIKPCIESKPPPSPVKQIPPSPVGQVQDAEDMPSTSA